jgi:UDP-N-acetylmuramoyl-L-alanyl-D-glutamate--2,6-diaminopimelate ligase
MEASSHAIVQGRMIGLQLAGAIFLNISHEHLDYHLTFDAYIQAKKTLFDRLPKNSFALYNADDRRGKIMIQNTAATPHSYALQTPATFRAQVVSNTWQGLELRIHGKNVWLQLLGAFNASNALAAYATALLLEQPSEDILVSLSAIKPIPGRFQHIRTPQGFDIIIDYAHKPDALENVLTTLQAIRKNTPKTGKIITVVGCGGNRDTQKRPLMAQIGYRYSDLLILTSDNPRYEDPQAIIGQMKQGLSQEEQLNTLSIIDRTEAIKTVFRLAQPGDAILIAGKGSEDYQEIAGFRYSLSDEKIVYSLLAPSI